MKFIIVRLNDVKYKMFLNSNGDCVAYAVEMSVKGKRTFWKTQWDVKRHGLKNGDVPKRVKDLFEVRGISEMIANEMGW